MTEVRYVQKEAHGKFGLISTRELDSKDMDCEHPMATSPLAARHRGVHPMQGVQKNVVMFGVSGLLARTVAERILVCHARACNVIRQEGLGRFPVNRYICEVLFRKRRGANPPNMLPAPTSHFPRGCVCLSTVKPRATRAPCRTWWDACTRGSLGDGGRWLEMVGDGGR